MIARDPASLIGRPELGFPVAPLPKSARVLVTGGRGLVGQALEEAILVEGRAELLVTDLPELDVRNATDVGLAVIEFAPTLIVNFAAAKLAPAGELDPVETATTSVLGAANLAASGVRLVQVSTCKAADPETCYGAGKLIAERIALNAGGSVVRFVNILEAGPSVLDVWDAVPEDEPLPVMECYRFLMTTREAVLLTLWACSASAGRYKLDVGDSYSMLELAELVYPGRPVAIIPRRRGDRIVEPACAWSEELQPVGGGLPIDKVVSYHDA